MRKHLHNDLSVYYESDKPSFGQAAQVQVGIRGLVQLTMKQLVGILLLIVLTAIISCHC